MRVTVKLLSTVLGAFMALALGAAPALAASAAATPTPTPTPGLPAHMTYFKIPGVDVFTIEGLPVAHGSVQPPMVSVVEYMNKVHHVSISSPDAKVVEARWAYASWDDEQTPTRPATTFAILANQKAAEAAALPHVADLRPGLGSVTVSAEWDLIPERGDQTTVHVIVDGQTVQVQTPAIPAGSTLETKTEASGSAWFSPGGPGAPETVESNRPVFSGRDATSAYHISDPQGNGDWRAVWPAHPVGTTVTYRQNGVAAGAPVGGGSYDGQDAFADQWPLPIMDAPAPNSALATAAHHSPGGNPIGSAKPTPSPATPTPGHGPSPSSAGVPVAAALAVGAAAAGGIWFLVAGRRRRRDGENEDGREGDV